jgi:hypothetical protein
MWNTRYVIADVDKYSVPNLREDLKACLRFFEEICSNRDSIHPSKWLFMFYLLRSISIVKLIMINTQVLRSDYNGDLHSDKIHIGSTYSILVRIFT